MLAYQRGFGISCCDNNCQVSLQPFKLLSVWDMVQFHIGNLHVLINGLEEFEQKLACRMIYRNMHSQILENKLVESLSALFALTYSEIEALELQSSKMLIDEILKDIKTTRTSQLRDTLKKLQSIMENELHEKFCMYVPKDRSKWFDQKMAFGRGVYDAFPAARTDIKEAASCYAVDRHTACVFHLMRVLEHGLADLAEDVGVDPGVDNWHNIIDQIERKIRDAQKQLPRGLERTERLQFLSEAAKEFTYFKDGWRNHVSHSRSKYDADGAASILNHVRIFMIHLSTKLGEDKHLS